MRNSEPFQWSSPVRDEEVWFISRGPIADSSEEMPGSGTLTTLRRGSKKPLPLPLKQTEVNARVDGYIGTVEVTQKFHNPYDSKIEAVYVFPLPHDSAVNEFLMIIGERRIRGIIREREEAERLYRKARSQGYVASLMTEERPNIFTQSVANIEPGREIDVKINYFHTLPYVDGWYEFVFPMVVGPRFNPPGAINGIGSAPRGAHGASGQQTEVEYLKPGERGENAIALRVDLNPGVEIEEIDCRTHSIRTEVESPEHRIVSLSRSDRIANRDFVLRFRVAGERIKSSLVTSEDERGGFFTMMLFPPGDVRFLQREAREMVFVLDCSGSMAGIPLAQAKAAIRQALNRLEPDDTFQIIRFSDQSSQMARVPILATPVNVRRGLSFVDSLDSEGGTEMMEGIKAALDFHPDSWRQRFVCFLTDGYIGNEAEVLAAIQQRIGEARIFSFGVGSSVNRYLLEHMAKLGRGAVAYLGPKDSGSAVMEKFFERVRHPALTDLRVDWPGNVSEVFPERVPDLFVGRPVILTGRYHGKAPSTIRVHGRLGDRSSELLVRRRTQAAEHVGIPTLWARMKIGSLSDRAFVESKFNLQDEMRELAIDYGLLSPFTAFVAVDGSRRTTGDSGTTVPVAVPVPQGVRYDTTVSE